MKLQCQRTLLLHGRGACWIQFPSPPGIPYLAKGTKQGTHYFTSAASPICAALPCWVSLLCWCAMGAIMSAVLCGVTAVIVSAVAVLSVSSVIVMTYFACICWDTCIAFMTALVTTCIFFASACTFLFSRTLCHEFLGHDRMLCYIFEISSVCHNAACPKTVQSSTVCTSHPEECVSLASGNYVITERFELHTNAAQFLDYSTSSRTIEPVFGLKCTAPRPSSNSAVPTGAYASTTWAATLPSRNTPWPAAFE